MDKRTKKKWVKKFGVCVWSTGLGKPLRRRRAKGDAPKRRAPRRRRRVDARLRVRGAEGVYAIGDCADVKSAEDPGKKSWSSRTSRPRCSSRQTRTGTAPWTRTSSSPSSRSSPRAYPQVRALLPEDGAAGADAGDSHLQSIMDRFDDDKSGALDFREFAKAMAEADARLSSHPATAQVANQQGEYLARALNAAARERRAPRRSGEGVGRRRAVQVHAPREFRDARIGAGRDGASRGLHQHGVRHDGAVVRRVHEQLRVVAEQVSRRRRLDQKIRLGEGTVRACETHQGVNVCTGDARARTYVSTVVTRFFAFVTFRTMAHVLPDVARRYCLVPRRLGSRARRDG